MTVARLTSPAAIILTAGMGRRLHSVGFQRPKWLLEISGETIAERQLGALNRAGFADARVIVVAGHDAASVQRFADEWPSVPHPEVVVNHRYADLNNWFSLLLGLEYLGADNHGDVAIILNGDVYADLGWFIPFLEAAAKEEFEALLAVDPTPHPPAEAMKVAVHRDEGSRPRVTAIGKTGIDRAEGEYVGLAALGPATIKSLVGILRRFRDDSTRADEWYEGAFQLAIEDGVRFEAWEVPHRNWVEIDTPADLRSAQRMSGSNHA